MKRITTTFIALFAAGTVFAQSAPKPNILHILVDDLGWQDLSLPLAAQPTEFNARYRTPNVERLAREGLVFTQAYAAAPVCTPTRAAIHTGIAPARSHITYWTLRKDSDTSAPWPGCRGWPSCTSGTRSSAGGSLSGCGRRYGI